MIPNRKYTWPGQNTSPASTIQLSDPDTFITWHKIDEPGENPAWESRCGRIEQISFGHAPEYQGFVGQERTRTKVWPTLALAKKDVERAYQSKHQIEWAYEQYLDVPVVETTEVNEEELELTT